MSRDIIIILGLFLIVVVGWISVDVFKAIVETEAPVVSPEVFEPVNPEFDFEVIKDLRSRK